MKKIFTLILLLISFSSYAANVSSAMNPPIDNAPPTTDPAFCARFKAIAFEHCKVDAPKGTPCNNIALLYTLMMSKFGTLEKACSYAAQFGSEKRTSAAQCVQDWNCYRLGTAPCYAKCM